MAWVYGSRHYFRLFHILWVGGYCVCVCGYGVRVGGYCVDSPYIDGPYADSPYIDSPYVDPVDST